MSSMDSLRLYSLAGFGSTLVAAAIYAIIRKRRKTPEMWERERRERIQQHGRITDGTVIDTHEIPGDDNGFLGSQLVMYTYDVGGVTYEASQDVTSLRPYVDLHACRIGLPASIKYDPQNPGNSIVIAEGWTGLRKK